MCIELLFKTLWLFPRAHQYIENFDVFKPHKGRLSFLMRLFSKIAITQNRLLIFNSMCKQTCVQNRATGVLSYSKRVGKGGGRGRAVSRTVDGN